MTFGQWALDAAHSPWNRAYEVTNANYPPGALLFFELIGRVYGAVGGYDPDHTRLRIALKLPNVLFDLIGGGVTYAIALRFIDGRAALLPAALSVLNPALIYDSSLWGQNDSITAVTALAALWCVASGRRAAGWIVLAFAVLNKPPVIVLAPLFLLEAWCAPDEMERRRRLVQTAAGLAGVFVCAYLVALPFYTDRSPVAVFVRLIDWYGVGSSLYPFTSANAFNIYAFGRFFAPDTGLVLGVPLKYWADGTYAAVAVAIWRWYAGNAGARTLPVAAFATLLAFFCILTEMHERYLIYALTFAPILVALDRRYLWLTIALTISQWLNLEYSLTYLWIESDKPAGIDPASFAPVLARLCAATNVAVLVWILNDAARGRSAAAVSAPDA